MSKNWKLVKKLISDYQKKQEGGGGDNSFIPIIVHKNTFPVSVNKDFVNFFINSYGIQDTGPFDYEKTSYEYIVYAAKKSIQNFNYFWVKIVINSEKEKGAPIENEQLIAAEDVSNFLYQVSLPNRIFGMDNKEKDVLLFDGSPMTDKQFKEAVKKWQET